jgi:3-phenylpropionate/trans-cinnamate dioxygenase ferredoxin reductase subunit
VPTRKVDYLLIGGGLASGNCARWLREEGADGEVVLVGREPDPPYNRPECSKGYLRGEESREDTYFRPNDFWQEQRIELLTRTSVTSLELASRTAQLSNKDEIEFDKALIATGANVRRLDVDGCHLEQIHYLRTLGNADAIRAAAEQAEQVVLIGGSFIGCEVAASLTALGNSCTIVMLEQAAARERRGQVPRRRAARALRGRGACEQGGDEGGSRAPGRHDRRRGGRDSRRGTRREGGPGDRGARRRALLSPSRDLGPRHLRRG